MTLHFTIDHNQIPMLRLSRRVMRPENQWRFWALVALASACVIAMMEMLYRYGVDVFPGFAFAYGLFVLWFLWSLIRRPFIRAQLAAPVRRTPVTVTLSEKDVRSENALFYSELSWPALPKIKRAKGYLLLMQSAREFIPLPLDQLPEGWDEDRLIAQIEDWRGQ